MIYENPDGTLQIPHIPETTIEQPINPGIVFAPIIKVVNNSPGANEDTYIPEANSDLETF
jgi:hypothetical protein